MRDLYRQNKDIRSIFGPDPFDMSRDPGFIRTYNRRIYGSKSRVTLLCESIYNSRADLQAHFPRPSANGGYELCHWFVKNARMEYGLDDVFVFQIREDLKNTMAPKTCLKDLLNLLKSRALIMAAQFTRAAHRPMDRNDISAITSLLSTFV